MHNLDVTTINSQFPSQRFVSSNLCLLKKNLDCQRSGLNYCTLMEFLANYTRRVHALYGYKWIKCKWIDFTFHAVK